jgi:hypothetical protein
MTIFPRLSQRFPGSRSSKIIILFEEFIGWAVTIDFMCCLSPRWRAGGLGPCKAEVYFKNKKIKKPSLKIYVSKNPSHSALSLYT